MADVNDNSMELNEIQSSGRFGDIAAKLNNNFRLIIEAILKKRDGKSAYELWVEQPGNEGKTLNEFLASLKESGYKMQAVTVRPSTIAGIEADKIYLYPDGTGQFSTAIYTGDLGSSYDSTKWVVLATNPGDLSGAFTDISRLREDVNNLDALVGYFTCSTDADNDAKSVNATGYVLTNGGNIRIKMTHANTASSGVTLQIGSAAAQTLYYNGEEVSDENTWGDNEVLVVYYDGTSYYATNSLGGGGGKSDNKGLLMLKREEIELPNQSGYHSGYLISKQNVLSPIKSGIGTAVQNIPIQDSWKSCVVKGKMAVSYGHCLIDANSGVVATFNDTSKLEIEIVFSDYPTAKYLSISASNSELRLHVNIYQDESVQNYVSLGADIRFLKDLKNIIAFEQIYTDGGYYNDRAEFVSHSGSVYTNAPCLIPIGATKAYYTGSSYSSVAKGAIIWLDEKQMMIGYFTPASSSAEGAETTIPQGAVYYLASSYNSTCAVEFDVNKISLGGMEKRIEHLEQSGLNNEDISFIQEIKQNNVEENVQTIGIEQAGTTKLSTSYIWGTTIIPQKSGRILKFIFNTIPTSDGILKIGQVELNDDESEATLISLYTFNYAAGEQEVLLNDCYIQAGKIIVVYDSKQTVLYSTGGYKPFIFLSSTATVGSTSSNKSNVAITISFRLQCDFSYNVLTRNKEILDNIKDRLEAIEEGGALSDGVTVDDCTTILYLGSSLTDSYYQPKSTSWIERLNDIVDVNLVNDGVSGKNLLNNMTSLITNAGIKHDSVNTPRSLKPTYICFNNSANGTTYGETGLAHLKNAKEICESLGAKMLLGSEEDFNGIAKRLETTYKCFAREHGIPYSPIIQTWRKCYPNNRPFKGDIGNNHGGYRLMAPYLKHLDMLTKIPIYKNVKMFKARPTYKAGSPMITDLYYDTNLERLRYFTAISCGAADELARGYINGMDNLDNHDYDVTGGVDTGISVSETSYMCRRYRVEFSKFALVEFIIEKVNITRAAFSVVCSVQPTAVYVAKTNNTSQTYTEAPRTVFENVNFDYDDGNLTCNILSQSHDIQLYDKVRIIIECSGAFTLTNPMLGNYDGEDKIYDSTIHYDYRKIGTELRSETSVVSGWTLTGEAAVRSLPSAIANYTNYNSETSHVQLNSEGDSMSIGITIPVGTSKLAIRIVGQMFTKYASTRWEGTELENSEYIANTAQYVNYDYDYGRVLVQLGDSIVRDILMYCGWSEQYMEVDIDPTETNLTLSITKMSYVDDSYSNDDKPIFIHDVSVQKIG